MTDTNFKFVPVVIIGAARSGTNALRDAICRIPGFATWPCDEINPIWRHGNIRFPNDELPEERATIKVRRFIRKSFVRIWNEQGRPEVIVEKTCANTLRVPFVDAVIPEARYIHIRRNGLDVIASAQKRWQGELEVDKVRYLLSKARYAPIRDLPLYAFSYVRRKLGLWAGKSERLSIWGPRFANMEMLSSAPLELLCAEQWAASVIQASRSLERLDPARVMTIAYEDFAANPVKTLEDIGKFLGRRLTADEVNLAAEGVSLGSVGKGQKMSGQLSADVMRVLAAPMKLSGYEV